MAKKIFRHGSFKYPLISYLLCMWEYLLYGKSIILKITLVTDYTLSTNSLYILKISLSIRFLLHCKLTFKTHNYSPMFSYINSKDSINSINQYIIQNKDLNKKRNMSKYGRNVAGNGIR